MSTFSGFSEEELNRIKSGETGTESDSQINTGNFKKAQLGGYRKKIPNKYQVQLKSQTLSDDAIDNFNFDKCKLSIRSPSTPPNNMEFNENKENVDKNDILTANINLDPKTNDNKTIIEPMSNGNVEEETVINRKNSVDTPDIVRGVENYTEDELANHKVKLEELQLRQKIMEEQNKKRKEMLAKALADRTKQTAEEVMRLEKIKKELQVLDSQFSQDVSVLRAKIDHACLSYADAEKHYLKVEKEFLQAKIQLQKEREKKELLTEHLCALITHNETRKAQKLETLMLELATDKKSEISDVNVTVEDENPVIVDGVDERTGKIVELPQS